MTTLVPNELVPRVAVGPFLVADWSRSELVSALVARALVRRDRPYLAFALHVGGLNSRHDREFVLGMRAADVVYADGVSVVWLCKLAGARSVQRTPTTDIGWDMLRGLTAELGRPPRVALIGAEPGLANRAAAVLQGEGAANVVFVEHGYHGDWSDILAALRVAAPEVSIIGMGAPREMLWAQQYHDEIPGNVLLTCGGWFGHLTGDERRAPQVMRRLGLEWLVRLAQAPQRLGPRYARGLASTAIMSVATILRPRP